MFLNMSESWLDPFPTMPDQAKCNATLRHLNIEAPEENLSLPHAKRMYNACLLLNPHDHAPPSLLNGRQQMILLGFRYEIDKLTASQRLDLNLEKGRMRDEMQALRDKTNELEIRMDKETNSLKAALEQTKNETIKYCLGMMFAFTTAGLAVARLVW